MHDTPHIVLVGPMGAGKSSVGRGLAACLGMDFVDLDARIEAVLGMPIAEAFETIGEAGFRAHESRVLAQALDGAPAVIATGGGSVLDPGNRRAMRRAGRVVYLQVSPQRQLERVAGDAARPLLQVDDPARRLAELQMQREPLYREVADLVFDTSDHSAASAVAALHATLAGHEVPA